MSEYDLFVIGAGSAGVRAARMAAARGATVGIAEASYLGGTCVNVGCIPKKLYHFAAEYSHAFDESHGYGWQVGARPTFDWSVLVANKRREIARLNGIYRGLLERVGVEIHEGRASIADPHTVVMGEKRFRARHIVVATGGWPFVPDFPGSELAVTSNEIFDLPEFPRRILVVGGGYIAVELASIFAGLGSTTALSYRGDRLVKDFDEDIGKHLTHALGGTMRLHLRTNVKDIARRPDGSLLVRFEEGLEEIVDTVLMATGRRPNTAGLGLEALGVEMSSAGAIMVNDRYQTNVPSLYALGDVVGHMALTPVALAEAMVLVDQLFGDGTRTLSYEDIATAVFSSPEVGTVGLGEAAARTKYGAVAVFESDFRHLRHTLSGRQDRTYLKVVVDEATDRVVGMHMVGAEAGEIIQGFAAAMRCGMTKAQLDSTVGIHPTVAEEFVTLRERSR